MICNSLDVEYDRFGEVKNEAGGVYEIPLELHNVSALSRRVRILPTTTRFFSVTLISYLGEDSGMIAPGMHAVARVRLRQRPAHAHPAALHTASQVAPVAALVVAIVARLTSRRYAL